MTSHFERTRLLLDIATVKDELAEARQCPIFSGILW
jgi:hypothetical protein